ncbi:MAG: hypothetical protein JNL94_03235 [Planctomycetes bacterium]|nr:hypothetical protein [Planctomycetota bacterium]
MRRSLIVWCLSLSLVPTTLALREANAQGFAAAPDPDYGDAAERERHFDLRHVRIDVKLDLERETVSGAVTHTIEPLALGLTEIALDAPGLSIRATTVNGANAKFSIDGPQLRIALDRRYAAGETLDVRVDYEGSPTVGLYWVRPEEGYPDKPWQAWTQGQDEDNRYWVPLYDFPNDRTTWETLLTVKQPLSAVSNGVLVGVTDAGDGWRTFHHRMEQPNSTYLIAFAVGAWERYADTWREKPVEYFVAPGVGEETARRSFGVTPQILEFFSNYTGVEYPWPKYAQVAVAQFVVGGMENVSCTLQTDRTLHDATAALERSSQGLVAHEAAHQWFGDLVTCRTWKDLWLNEGFATYFDALFTEFKDGADEFRCEMRDNQRGFMAADPDDAPRPMVSDFYSRGVGGVSNHVYTKGASVLHMLRFVLGDDAFRASIRVYLERHRMGLVETRDLQTAIADVTGRNLEWFFEQWVMLAGQPAFDVRFAYDDAAKQGTLTVKQTQKTGGLVPVFRTPVDVEFRVDGASDVRRILIETAEQTFTFALQARPQWVRFDKGGWILKTLTFERSLDEWMAIAEHDDDVIGRLEAVDALANAADARAVDCLARVLTSNVHRRVKQAIADVLRDHPIAPVKGALLAALADPDARVRADVVDALRAFDGDADVHAALKQVLAADPAYGPRANALGALVATKASDVATSCEQALATKSHEDRLARSALSALVAIDPARAVPHVLDAATYGRSVDLRHAALDQFDAIADALDAATRTRAIEIATKGLADHWARTRRAAVNALVALTATEAIPALESLAAREKTPRSRDAAKNAIERIRKRANEAK